MSGLWGDDEVEVPENGEFEIKGGDGFEVIPAKTGVLFQIEQATMEEPTQYIAEEYINLRWSILKPELYANRKVFQKIQVFSSDKDKRASARKMLAAIDVNSDNRLSKYAEKKGKTLEDFTTEDLTVCLVGKTMSGVLMVWESKDKSKTGNWVQSIAPANATKIAKPTEKKRPVIDDDDDVPF